MTSLDCLREELKQRGMNKTQIESAVVAVVLDIVANSGNKYTKIYEAENDASKKLIELKDRIWHAEVELNTVKHAVEVMRKEEEELRRRREHFEDYIDKFNKGLNECETAEGRDAMRTAQVYINSVDVDTKYDNTAYIIGLASILSNGKISAIEELQKINKKIPSRLS